MVLSRDQRLTAIEAARETDGFDAVFQCGKCNECYYKVADFIVHKIESCIDEDFDLDDPFFNIKKLILKGRNESKNLVQMFRKVVSTFENPPEFPNIWDDFKKCLDGHAINDFNAWEKYNELLEMETENEASEEESGVAQAAKN